LLDNLNDNLNREKIRKKMNKEEIIKTIKEKFPEDIEEIDKTVDLTIKVKRDKILSICKFLHDAPGLEFDYLVDICGVDYPGRPSRFDVVYHFCSIKRKHRIRLKASLGEGEFISSVESVWKAANWYEREVYDLLGIKFDNHPNLQRILLPDEWEGHPLRKDYPLVTDEGEKWLEEKLKTYLPEEVVNGKL